MERKIPWRGLFALLVSAVGNGELPKTATVEQIQEWCGKTHPELPPVLRSTVLVIRKRLVEAQILGDASPSSQTKVYEGFLFDEDGITITLGEKSWTFTREQAQKVSRLFENLAAFTSGK